MYMEQIMHITWIILLFYSLTNLTYEKHFYFLFTN